jgi:hypothetical protein
MPDTINIGLDFGSLGWRAAFAQEDAVTSLPVPPSWDDAAQWLFCERIADTIDGIHFPAVKENLGAAPGAREIAHARFAELYALAGKQTGRQPGHLVVAVPALYPSSNRGILRETALACGFADVHLLNDSMAAAIAHTNSQAGSSVVLVYSIGYAGFEIGLIRTSKGRYRAVAYEGGAAPSGAELDAIIARSWLLSLVDHGLWSRSRQYPVANWLTLRNLAQHAKERLSTEEIAPLSLPFELNGLHAILPGSLVRARLDSVVAPAIGRSLDAAEKLLEDTGLTAAALDAVLLVGGPAAMPSLQRAIEERFGRPPVIGDRALLAAGASLYSARLGGAPATDTAVIRGMDFNTTATLPATLSPVQSGYARSETVFSLNFGTAGPSAPLAATSLETLLQIREKLFQQARALIAEDAYEKASGFLQGVTEEAQALLARVPTQAPVQKWKLAESLQMISDLLAGGRLQQAVEVSHQIYALDQEDPLIFRRMLEVHLQAARAMQTIDGYKKSIEWLDCALAHDRTNRKIQEEIAERHFLHAQQVAALGRAAEAQKAIQDCLQFVPDHAGAREFASRVSSPPFTDAKQG